MNITCDCGNVDNIEVKDKKGFLCEICGTYFDVTSNGSMVKYPIHNDTVKKEGAIDGCFGSSGTVVNIK